MINPRRKSTKSRKSSSRSVVSNLEQSGNNADVSVIRDLVAIPPSRTSSNKWREINKDEEQDFIVNSIRDEIIASALDVIHDKYLEKKSYAFVVHCSYRAWLQFFDLINMQHDPGENVQTIAENWSYDEAPDPVPPDPWACRRMIVKKEQFPETCSASTCSMKTNIQPEISVPLFTFPTLKPENSRQFYATEQLAENEEKPITEEQAIISEKSSSVIDDGAGSLGSLASQRSIFTRTISMVKANLPVSKWQSQQRSYKQFATNTRQDKRFRTTTEAVSATSGRPLDLRNSSADR